jgi:hypothetical protein
MPIPNIYKFRAGLRGISPRFCPGLPEQHGDELAPPAKPTRMEISLVFANRSLEFRRAEERNSQSDFMKAQAFHKFRMPRTCEPSINALSANAEHSSQIVHIMHTNKNSTIKKLNNVRFRYTDIGDGPTSNTTTSAMTGGSTMRITTCSCALRCVERCLSAPS